MNNLIRIGTRGSALALWQARDAEERLKAAGVKTQITIIRSDGDLFPEKPFAQVTEPGFFTSLLDRAVQSGKIDIAVHSLKDLPTSPLPGLVLAGVSKRADPADWLIIRKASSSKNEVLKLGKGAKVGTSSTRRSAQISHVRPDVKIVGIRGNVPNRIDKLQRGEYDAIVLAAAGLTRLQMDLSAFTVVHLHPREFVPAPGQGVIAYRIRTGDQPLHNLVKKHLHHPDVWTRVNIERNILLLLDGGCNLPLGAYCEQDRMGYYHVWTTFAHSLDSPIRHHRLSYSTTEGLAEAIADYYLKSE